MTGPTFADLDDFYGQVRGLIIELSTTLSPEACELADDLVRHGEIGEGLLMLACAIVSEGKQVPRHIVTKIIDWSDGLTPAEDMPTDLAAHALD